MNWGKTKIVNQDYQFKPCPTTELFQCWAYEFARESEPLLKLVMDWRKEVDQAEEPKIRFSEDSGGISQTRCWFCDIAFEHYSICDGVKKWRSKIEAAKLHSNDRLFIRYLEKSIGALPASFLLSQTQYFVPYGNFYMYPEWPDEPYLSIPQASRRFRLSTALSAIPEASYFHFFGSANRTALDIEKPFLYAQKASEAINPGKRYELLDEHSDFKREKTWAWLVSEMKKNFLHHGRIAARSRNSEYVLFRIPWQMPLGEIAKALVEWIKNNKPADIHQRTDVRGGSPTRVLRQNLRKLGKFRVVKHQTKEGKEDFHFGLNDEKLFASQADWIECRTAVHKVIDAFWPLDAIGVGEFKSGFTSICWQCPKARCL